MPLNQRLQRATRACLLASGLTFAASAHAATVYTLDFLGTPLASPTVTGTLTTATGPVSRTVPGGLLAFQSSPQISASAFLAYCIDLLNPVEDAPGYVIATPSEYGWNAATLTAMQRLFGNGRYVNSFNGGAGGASTAGFQLAIWEVVYDTGTAGGYSLTSGNFTGTSDAATIAAAQGYLAAVTSGEVLGDTPNFRIWDNQANPTGRLFQDVIEFVGLNPRGVPEPGVLALMAAFALAFSLRAMLRRKSLTPIRARARE
jgi:hypothetical protein